MNRFRRGNSAVIAALFACSCGLAVAQAPPDAGAQPPGAIGTTPTTPQAQDVGSAIQSLIGDLNIGPLMMSVGGITGQNIDFTHSAERIIVKRSDVTAALLITSKQREQFGDIETQGKQQMLTTLMQAATTASKDVTSIQPSSDGTPPDPSQIKDFANKAIESMQTAVQALQGDLDVKCEEILTPKQLLRLHELDLQWRGPLALSDKNVASKLNVTPEQQAIVEAALKDYVTIQSTAVKAVMKQLFNTPGILSGHPNVNPAQVQQAMNDAMHSDELTKARASDEKKVVASLTPEQKAKWAKMQGAKFVFHIEE